LLDGLDGMEDGPFLIQSYLSSNMKLCIFDTDELPIAGGPSLDSDTPTN
jgi:hypothetical protein